MHLCQSPASPLLPLLSEIKITMEKGSGGSRQNELKQSFNMGVNTLLTAYSKQDFCKAFPRFTEAEQERLHRLCIEVIVALHQNIEGEFEVLCQQTEVGNILDTVEELVEEQTLDPLYSDKTNLKDVEQVLSILKKNEIQNLSTMLEKTEAQNKVFRTRVELLQKELEDPSVTSNALEKAKTGTLNNGTSNSTDPS